MTREEFAEIVEFEGWMYALTEISPSHITDSALAEALYEAQEAFRILVDATPEVSVDFSVLDGLEELDFDE